MANSVGLRRVHLFISGRVQGVFYRASARSAARRLGLSGWVRNLPDGRVELVAEGEAPAIEALVAWAETGPEHAVVTHVDARDEPYQGVSRIFEIRE